MARKSMKKRLKIIHPHCAGIAIGSREHWVAVDPDQDDEPVRCFSSFSDDLYALADWLESLNVEIVAMEATGVYWIPLYEVLDALGIKTVLVIASEIGPDLSRFPSSGYFCSWLSLAPPTRISGGKPLPGKIP